MRTQSVFYVPGRSAYTPLLARSLTELLPATPAGPLIILCIGTMQVKGDRLGPMVGSLLNKKLQKTDCPFPVHIFGTEEQTVHALNLYPVLRSIYRDFPGAPILAVDAALSGIRRTGCITIGPGPLLPGAGLSKQLPAAGDVHITGTVSCAGVLGYFFLKHTPSRKVLRLADIIADSIWQALPVIFAQTPSPSHKSLQHPGHICESAPLPGRILHRCH